MDGYEEKRKELDALIEQAPSYLVRCYECPVINPCSHSDEVRALSANILTHVVVTKYMLSDAIDTLKAMREIGKKCPLLNGCDHHFSKRERRG